MSIFEKLSSTANVTYMIKTMVGSCFVEFPAGHSDCEFFGINKMAIDCFRLQLPFIYDDEGYLLDLSNITPEEFLKWCNRPDLGVEVLDVPEQYSM